MTLTQAFLIYLYLVGAAGWGHSVINLGHQTRASVIDLLLIIAWPLTGLVWLAANFVGEVRK